MSIRAVSEKEAAERRRKEIAKLQPGCMFETETVTRDAQQYPSVTYSYFIAVARVNDEFWDVVELTSHNRRNIREGKPCATSRLPMEAMGFLRVFPDTH